MPLWRSDKVTGKVVRTHIIEVARNTEGWIRFKPAAVSNFWLGNRLAK